MSLFRDGDRQDFESFYNGLVSASGGERVPRPPPAIPSGKPKFVKLLPGDNGEGMPESFFGDPHELVPKAGQKGEVQAWGLYPYGRDNIAEFDGVAMMFRTMKTQTKYDEWAGKPTPESQFMKVILDRKRNQLANLDLHGLDKRDVILRISLIILNDSEGQPRFWRRFRVSAGIKMGTFQDKVVSPIMGWVRNLHCYHFTDFRDGSLYGPDGSTAIDRQHICQVGYDYLPDDKYMLAHLFGKEGDKIGYLYDFGDKWYHEIEVERILPLEESYGRVELVDGKGMCPGENMQGTFHWERMLQEYDAGSYVQKNKTKREILNCPNYNDFQKPPSLFSIDAFDHALTTTRLTAALNSPNSVRAGAKQFTMPIAPTPELDAYHRRNLKKGQSIVRDYDPDSFGYWQETRADGKDRRSGGVCALCGKPGGVELKTCSGCRAILYCSVEHQKIHWKDVHKHQCSRKYLKK